MPDVVRSEDVPKTSIWLSPVLHALVFLSSGLISEELHVAVPIGVGRNLSDSTMAVLEVTPMLTRTTCRRESMRCASLRQLKVSLGVAWKPWPKARGQGFFIQPRLTGMWSVDTQRFRPSGRAAALTYEEEHGFQATLGLDVGYRVVTRRSGFFFEPVFGLGMGYGVNQRRQPLDVRYTYGSSFADKRSDGAVTDLNLDLLRLGITF
ncbi:hypothetical protein HUW62_21875 [Myxococcus sp. AM011]|uniref:hypothetical protein n=1 Tax=Myxococcus sp. AM011 TaxID=2745200 RepID=UPI00159632DF|nr:hypothetical protein [Myxococcus sp. AM011]NVJ23880.1 hypothetical protein [Myxococcus sp. AM011]